MIHIGDVTEIKPIEEFEARLLLTKMNECVLYRVSQGKDKLTQENYLTPLEDIKWLKQIM